MSHELTVLVAGIGGASLGTELLKCLLLAGRYDIAGCDISPLAFGHYQPGFRKTLLADRDDYVGSVLEACAETGARYIIPGGEEPMVLLARESARLAAAGVGLAGNHPAVIARFSDKRLAFEILAQVGIPTPLTLTVGTPQDLDPMRYPCVIKPATGSGGSTFVFLAGDREEALLYVSYLNRNGRTALVQEYLPEDEGEFTIGVLSLPGGRLAGSVAMRRLFNSKLSVLYKGRLGLISSGYSQGEIDDFPALRQSAERIAAAIGSEGPINVQGRVRNGVLIPFEINPRFSASTYLRALAGFNEVDVFLQFLASGRVVQATALRPGYYLRSLAETYVPREQVRS